MNRGSHADVVPRPAATVVLLRPGSNGAEVLLTRRPSTMAFAANLHVFPGGAVDDADRDTAGTDEPWAVARHAAVREAREEAGIQLDPAALVALSHWTTPPILPRRFSTRFFVAQLPPGAEPRFDTNEVVDHVWLTPAAALEAMGDGSIELWIPTSSTLIQLEGVRSLDDVRDRYGSSIETTVVPPPRVERLADHVVRIVAFGAGGIPGHRAVGALVGKRRFVLIDHGDPSDAAADAVLDVVDAAGGRLEAIVVNTPRPDFSGGAEGLALRVGIPVVTFSDVGRWLPHEVVTVEDLDALPFGDTPLRGVAPYQGLDQRSSGSTSSTRMSNASRWTDGSRPGK